jgi:RNA polymerase sigma-70 factor, ECF subfamily
MSESAAGSSGKEELDAVLPQIFPQLHRLAASMLWRERAAHTLQPTALVNEVYLRLVGQRTLNFNNRAQVLGIAAEMMRRILCTHEEGRRAAKRGGELTIVCLDDAPEPEAQSELPFGLVDETLDRLAKLDQRQAKVAELRIFGGLTVEEVGEYLSVSPATVSRDWFSAKLWLTRELRRSAQNP